jgi:hypothetical protein
MRNGAFWSSVLVGLQDLESRTATLSDYCHRERMLLRFPYRTVFYCFNKSKRVESAWNALFPSTYAHYGHGDLNPRNILMVKSGTGFKPIMIDFHRFGGPIPLPIDFCRLEAGICIKGLKSSIDASSTSAEGEDELVDFENYVNTEEFWDDDIKATTIRFNSSLYKAAITVKSIRECYRRCLSSYDAQDRRAYWGTLFLYYLNYIRPVYEGRLTLKQRLYSLYAAMRIFERTLLH